MYNTKKFLVYEINDFRAANDDDDAFYKDYENRRPYRIEKDPVLPLKMPNRRLDFNHRHASDPGYFSKKLYEPRIEE